MTRTQQHVFDALRGYPLGATVEELAHVLAMRKPTVNRHLRALYRADRVHWRAENRGKLGQSVYVWYVGKWAE